jgi:hypothetical protein
MRAEKSREYSRENHSKLPPENVKEKDRSGDLDVDERKILKHFKNRRLLCRLNWHKLGSSGGHLL